MVEKGRGGLSLESRLKLDPGLGGSMWSSLWVNLGTWEPDLEL